VDSAVRKSLARRPTENDVNQAIADLCLLPKFLCVEACDISYQRVATRKILFMRSCCEFVRVNRCNYVDACRFEA
jgi:hypothetical protein